MEGSATRTGDEWAAVHDNSMYLGIGQSMLKLELAAVAVGNARGP